MAAEIVEKSGGVENIKTVAHCATDFVSLVNKDIVDMEGIRNQGMIQDVSTRPISFRSSSARISRRSMTSS